MSPSDAAKLDQFNYPSYPGIDNWQDCNLHTGNIVYIWEADGQIRHGSGDAYAMTPETALGCNGDPNKLQDSLQTNLDPRYDTHRGHLQAYRINEETPAAFSHCEANICHGAGGGEQYYIPGFDDRLKDGRIEKADDLNLNFNQNALGISDAQIATDQKNTANQPQSTSPTPSQGTTPTLDGAYQGPTPNTATELKPRVDAAQEQWNNMGSNQIAGHVPNDPPPTASNDNPIIAGCTPDPQPSNSENPKDQIAGTTPDKKQSLDQGNQAPNPGKDLVEDAGKKAPDGAGIA